MASAGTMHNWMSVRLAGERPVRAGTLVLSKTHSMTEVQLSQHSLSLQASVQIH